MPARHPQRNAHHGHADQHGQPPEQRAPAHQRHGPLHRQGGGHHAQRARHQHPGIGTHLRRGIEPAAVAGKRRHQAGTHPRAAQHAPGQQAREPRGHREHQATRDGHAQKAEQHLLRAMPVQPGTERQLRGRKAQKVAARQQAQVAGVQGELLRQRGRQGGRDGAQQGRKEVGEREGQEDDDGRAPWQHTGAHGNTSPLKKVSATSGRGLGV